MTIDEILNKTGIVDELKAELIFAERNQSWAAKQLGISRPYVSLIFKGHNEPSMEIVIEMKRLADKLKSIRLGVAV
jgi:DNA-binding XRE family transcriptional regulator